MRLFTPTLTVQGFDLDDSAAQELTVVADPISLNGDRVQAPSDGSIWLGDALLVPANGQGPNAADVASMSIEAISAVELNEVLVRARALDSQGNAVEGLPASAFTLDEDGEVMSFLLRSNASRPRVKVISDQSSSMPSAFRGAAAQAFVDQLAAKIKQVQPYIIDVGKSSFGAQILCPHCGSTVDGSKAVVRRLRAVGSAMRMIAEQTGHRRYADEARAIGRFGSGTRLIVCGTLGQPLGAGITSGEQSGQRGWALGGDQVAMGRGNLANKAVGAQETKFTGDGSAAAA